jgi:serine/threonine protein kinase
MEWVPGGNWFHRLGCETPPPAHQRMRAVREISSAMQYLHDPMIGIIHGDIKGLNMLLMRDGSSKVTCALYCGLTVRVLHLMSSPQFCDFGGAVQVLTTASSMSSAGSATQAATKSYEAPERFKGEPKSTATDVWRTQVDRHRRVRFRRFDVGVFDVRGAVR